MFLAQANIAIFRWPIEDPRMADFANSVTAINELAERSDGFVWRFQGDEKPRGSESPWDHPLLFFNMSVWRDLDSLLTFVRSSQHVAIMKRRTEWVLPVEGPSSALWWIEESMRPNVDDAILAISRLVELGNSPESFSFGSPFAHQPRTFDK